jgi:Fe-S-cluster containining protein
VKKQRSHKTAPAQKAPARIDPTAPPKARRIEQRIVALLEKLAGRGYPSCLDNGFLNDWNAILSLFSQYQREVLDVYPLKMTCGEGCGICCNHWPEDTFSFEVLIIADHLKKHRARDKGRIIKTLQEDIECLDRIKNTVAERLLDPVERAALGDTDPYDAALSSFYQFNRSCPLLGKNGSCTIYAIRPFTCRVYMSFSPPELCRPESILGDDALTYLLDLGENADELLEGLSFGYDVFEGDTSFRSMLYKALNQGFFVGRDAASEDSGSKKPRKTPGAFF